MPFIANTDEQRRQMLAEIGLTMEGLFSDIPKELLCGRMNIGEGLAEQEVRNVLADLAGKNSIDLTLFLGGGFYDHFIPAAVYSIISRSEFYTAYTPYQPEVSQGTLQAIYEYQSMICRLTDMEVSNASLYDGGTAMYEAMMMALRVTGRNKVIIDDSVNPIYRVMIESYTKNLKIELVQTHCATGLADRDQILAKLDTDTAAVILQNPNFFGCIDDFSDIAQAAHSKGSLLIVSCYPISLGILKTPGSMGADIVTGEGQCLGMPMSFGGPYLGFMATRMEYVRKMPGRIIGRTKDRQGRDCFVMTLQAREQHIRREKATSNICTNQALNALAATVYMSLMGKEGLREVGLLCLKKAHYARKRILELDGFSSPWNAPVFKEFPVRTPVPPGEIITRLKSQRIHAGVDAGCFDRDLEGLLLVAVTERRTREEIDLFVEALQGCE